MDSNWSRRFPKARRAERNFDAQHAERGIRKIVEQFDVIFILFDADFAFF